MSFGWSVGDIVAALQLLGKVVVALKDTGGASSHYQDVSAFLGVLTVTLQHLKTLQVAPLNPDIAKNLEQLCAQIQGPLTSFRERIHSSFDRDLGSESTKLKFLTAGRKLQWAISTSKEVKDLEKKIGRNIAVIGVVLSQQVLQTTLQIPSEIQARIAHTIDTAVDTRINPLALAVHKEVVALSAAEEASSKLIKGTIRDVVRQNATEMQKHTQTTSVDLEKKFNALSLSQRTCTASTFRIEDRSRMILEAIHTQTSESRADSKTAQGIASDLFANQSRTTDIIVRAVREEGQKHTSASQKQSLSLYKKLDHMSSLMGTVNDHMSSLSIARQSAPLSTTNSEIETAIGSLRQSLWLLLSALHVLIRELIYLITPHLIALYRISIQPLLVYGDQFLFEDAIGRKKWLPCLQFQHWENFYNFLIDIFQGEVGLSRVLNGQFVVLNGFNEVPIYKKAWRAGIQPKSRAIMAIMVESTVMKKGRGANPACSGRINFGKDEVTRVCPICGKHLYTLKDVLGHDEYFSSEAQISILKDLNEKDGPPAQSKRQVDTETMKNTLLGTDKDVAAYKRVIWQDLNSIYFDININNFKPVRGDFVAGQRRRRRLTLARRKEVTAVRKVRACDECRKKHIACVHALKGASPPENSPDASHPSLLTLSVSTNDGILQLEHLNEYFPPIKRYLHSYDEDPPSIWISDASWTSDLNRDPATELVRCLSPKLEQLLNIIKETSPNASYSPLLASSVLTNNRIL